MDFDSEFIQLLIQQDELAFARFYEQSIDNFFRYISGHYMLSEEEASDIISDFYLKIWENLEKYDEKYEFWQFVRWIFKNNCKDYFKKSKPLFFSHLADDYDQHIVDNKTNFLDSDDKDDELFNFSVENTILMSALHSLSQEDQELVYTRYVLWYSYKTMSDMLWWLQQDAIRKKLSRILKKLKQQLVYIRD